MNIDVAEVFEPEKELKLEEEWKREKIKENVKKE